MRRVIMLFLFGSLFFVNPAYSYDDEITHRKITEEAIGISSLDMYLNNNLGFQYGASAIVNEKTITWWLTEGAYLEDSPMCRASNHFHNPLLPWDQSYMSDDTNTTGLLIRGWCSITGWPYSERKSLITWGTGYLSPGGAKTTLINQMGWDDARKYYLNALTAATESERESNFTNTFQVLGQVLHLIQDGAQPAHVRNDFLSHQTFNGISSTNPVRWFGSQYENYVKNHPELINSGAEIPSFSRITDFWDTDQYDGTNPSTGLSLGITEFTNSNYFSDETIPNNNPDPEHVFPYPQVNSSNSRICEDYAPDSTDLRKYISKRDCPGPGSAVDHFAAVSLLNEDPLIIDDNIPTLKLVLDENVYNSYAKELLPRAVSYSTGLLNYFFRGQIDMKSDPNIPGQYVIENKSGENMDGTVTLCYDDSGDNRSCFATWTFQIAGGQSQPITFTEPISPAPKENGKYILVFQGVIGSEKDAVAGKIIKLFNVGPYIKITNVKTLGPDSRDVTFTLQNDSSTYVKVPYSTYYDNQYSLPTIPDPVLYNQSGLIMRWTLSNGSSVDSFNTYSPNRLPYAYKWHVTYYFYGISPDPSFDPNQYLAPIEGSQQRVHLKPLQIGPCATQNESGEVYAWLVTHKTFYRIGDPSKFVGQTSNWNKKTTSVFGFTEEQIYNLPVLNDSILNNGGIYKHDSNYKYLVLSIMNPKVKIGTYTATNCSNYRYNINYNIPELVPFLDFGTDEVLYEISNTGTGANIVWTLKLVSNNLPF